MGVNISLATFQISRGFHAPVNVIGANISFSLSAAIQLTLSVRVVSQKRIANFNYYVSGRSICRSSGSWRSIHLTFNNFGLDTLRVDCLGGVVLFNSILMLFFRAKSSSLSAIILGFATIVLPMKTCFLEQQKTLTSFFTEGFSSIMAHINIFFV